MDVDPHEAFGENADVILTLVNLLASLLLAYLRSRFLGDTTIPRRKKRRAKRQDVQHEEDEEEPE
jgi:hypothetical protein